MKDKNKKENNALRGDIPCMDCGTEKNIIWSIENVFWNAVMDDNIVHNEKSNTHGSGILCVNCFAIRAEKKFKVRGWQLLPDWEWIKNN